MSQQRQTTAPELEITDHRAGTVRYIEHGVPSELIRWHAHDDYELHFIVATRGKVFVGDHIGPFAPGQLILTGPRLPHNWVCNGDQYRAELRDMALHFSPSTLDEAMRLLPELNEIRPMLERSRSGLEFLGTDPHWVRSQLAGIRETTGLARLQRFLALMQELAAWPDYRLLSSVQVDSPANEAAQQKINRVIDHVMAHYESPISLGDMARLVGMTETYFSRFFRQATGHRFVDFVNRVRISRACHLLVETDQHVTTICYEVGFNNVANFNRRFSDFKGMTPSQYRRDASQRYVQQEDQLLWMQQAHQA
ncbi:AraC family transcriptional regulator [Natronospirillum operosum]|uniref:AraC family transcriptional regulator n=1 Tax=Natronospirillum operosum TaxID=2759953 RepID=A0A4Z0WG86_9GAMM|nr:AraC family transcriptional regulator [Natronospirillum operosum]TGG94236.1 AraC family transcriptional regulator [Natronospirillum operosum]